MGALNDFADSVKNVFSKDDDGDTSKVNEVAEKATEVKQAADDAADVMQDDNIQTAVDKIGGDGAAEKVTDAANKTADIAGRVHGLISGSDDNDQQQNGDFGGDRFRDQQQQDGGFGDQQQQDDGFGDQQQQADGFGDQQQQDGGFGGRFRGQQQDQSDDQQQQDGGFGDQQQPDGGFGDQQQQDGGFGDQQQQDGGFGDQQQQDGGFGDQPQEDGGFGGRFRGQQQDQSDDQQQQDGGLGDQQQGQGDDDQRPRRFFGRERREGDSSN